MSDKKRTTGIGWFTRSVIIIAVILMCGAAAYYLFSPYQRCMRQYRAQDNSVNDMAYSVYCQAGDYL